MNRKIEEEHWDSIKYKIRRIIEEDKKDMINELTKLGWEKNASCYFKKIKGDKWYYNCLANVFSVDQNSIGYLECVCEGGLKNLDKVEKGEFYI